MGDTRGAILDCLLLCILASDASFRGTIGCGGQEVTIDGRKELGGVLLVLGGLEGILSGLLLCALLLCKMS